MSCEEKLRQIVFRLEDRVETVRGLLHPYSERLERAETEKHIREVISIFEADEKEIISVLKIAEVAENDGDQRNSTVSIYPSVNEINALRSSASTSMTLKLAAIRAVMCRRSPSCVRITMRSSGGWTS
jgi:hypothetical protein